MIKLTILISVFLLIACGVKKQEYKIHDRLIDFQSHTTMNVDQIIESGEKNCKQLYSNKFNPKTDTVRYEKDVIYVSCLSIVNECADYVGNINIKEDSIILKLINIGELECTEPRCDRLIYKIKNANGKRYKIKKW